MKHVKKIMALVLACVMVLAMGSMTVFAQEVNSGKNGTGSITISNAAKGETYSAYLLFEATLGANDEVAYKGSVPEGLTEYFEETSAGSGYVQATKAAFQSITYYLDEEKTTVADSETNHWTGEGMSDGLRSALTIWKNSAEKAVDAVSDGSELKFTNLVLGYYVVTTTQGEQLISVDTTNPDANINDKNTTTPTAVKKVNGSDEISASIGETVTYTAEFATTNYIGAEQVKSYTISDTLPEFLTGIQITEVKIIQSIEESEKAEYPDIDLSSSYTTFTDKKITIPWVDEADATTNLYKNGSMITVRYTAKITSTVNIDGAGNTNTVTLTPNKDRGGEDPFEVHYFDDAVVKTYGAALKKTDGTTALAGAEFTVAGLDVENVDGEPGVYRVVSYDSASTTPSVAMSTNNEGKLYIIGLKEDVDLVVTESKAPDGYNKLTETTTLTPQILSETIYETSGTRYYDAKGNLVSDASSTTTTKEVIKNYADLDEKAIEIINKAGTLLPTTGGIGTTIFYILGSILVLGAAVLLIAKKRMNAAK